MTTHTLTVSDKQLAALQAHLFRGEDEQVAFLLATTRACEAGVEFMANDDPYLVPEDGFAFQSNYHVELSDETIGKVIKQAWDSNTALVEIHSHRFAKYAAEFSPSDLSGFSEFVPHIWWRLKGRPYMAVVFAPSSIDALVWVESPTRAEALSRLRASSSDLIPTNITIEKLRRGNERDSL